ncbi:hypothetical protein QA640_38555 [Bradyrhizobium sp. CB82]|uniref:hypothetical protein n=1 Tax=Bradyrhizobium sp. CB82 TaxID=3039159 RepID=UPI0024B0D0A6|nr:hypothetical protein [Bradyrhizobium sp. CB82]WFU40065.1 hypothetical protein QA640_38555 [Bradyrhizobium sp. CB82]
MRRFQSTLIFVIFPLIGNIVLAVAAFVFNPADFRDHLETCYLTIAAVLMATVVSFIGFRVHDLGPKRTVLALLIQSGTLIFVFAGIYRGCALRLIATTRYDGSRPAATIDRDHPFRAIATSLWTGVMEAVG